MNPEIVAEERFDILGNLPKEICYKILLFLTPNDIANSFNCCKKWQQLINWKFVWKKLNRGSDSEEEPKSKVFQKMVRSYSVYGQGRFMYYRALKYNVKNQKYQRIQIDINQYEHTYEFMFVHMDDRITILGTESKFYIINSSCGLVEKTIKFTNLYYYIALRHFNYLVAIARDCNLKIWNIKDGTLVIEKSFESDGCNNTIAAWKHLIIIINVNDLVYVLDLRTKECRHISTAKYACCSKDFVAFLLNDGNIIIRDADYRCITSLNSSHHSREYIDTMQMNEDFLVLEFFEIIRISRHLSIFNIKTKANFNITISGSKSSYFKISKNRLIFGTHDTSLIGYFEIWDMYTQNCLFKIDNIKYYIHSLILHDSDIYIKSSDLKWQMWCLQTGQFVRELEFYYAGDQDIVAITDSKLLFKSARWDSYWYIRDFEANLYQKKKKIR